MNKSRHIMDALTGRHPFTVFLLERRSLLPEANMQK